MYPFALVLDSIQILTLKRPFYNTRADFAVALAVTSGRRPSALLYPEVDPMTWQIMEACWDGDPKRRPSMTHVVQHLSRLQDGSPESHILPRAFDPKKEPPMIPGSASPQHACMSLDVILHNGTSRDGTWAATSIEYPPNLDKSHKGSTSSVTSGDGLEYATELGSSSLSNKHCRDAAPPMSHQDKRFAKTTACLDVSTAQLALGRVNECFLEIGGALSLVCGVVDGEYLVQVGFDEEMIRRGEGSLQCIYIYMNFDMVNNAWPVLEHLGKLLSPFPAFLITPTTIHKIPFFFPDGVTLDGGELLCLLEKREIFVPASDIHHGFHSLALAPTSGGSQPLNQNIDDRSQHSGEVDALDVPLPPDDSGHGGGGSSGNSGIGGSGSGQPLKGGRGGRDQSSDRGQAHREDGNGGDPGNGPGQTGTTVPHNIGTLSIPLTATFELTKKNEGTLQQRFAVSSPITVTVREFNVCIIFSDQILPS